MNWKPHTGKPKGGSQYRSIFNDRDIARFNPSGKSQIAGIILPMFNHELLEQPNISRDSEAFLTGQMPFRSEEIDTETGLPSLYQPCVEIKVHKFVGPKTETFASAKSREYLFMANGTETSTEDPLCDIYGFASKLEDKTHPWYALTQDGSGQNGYAMISWPSSQFVFCADAVDMKATSSATKVGALLLSKAGVIDYLRLMDLGRRPDLCPTPRDPNYPFYLYGNVLDVNHPLKFKTVMKANPSNAGQTFAGFVFSSNEVSLAGSEECGAVSMETLRQRPHIYDAAIYDIMSYKTFLDQMVNEKWFDLELIKAACGGKGDIGGTTQLGNPAVIQQYAAAAPAPPAPPTAPSARVWVCVPGGLPREIDETSLDAESAAHVGLLVSRDGQWVAAKPEEPKYWVNLPGGTAEFTRSGLQELVNKGFTGQVILTGGEQVWHPVAEMGFTMPAPQAPAAPPAPAAPSAPAAPAAPSAPAAPPAPAAPSAPAAPPAPAAPSAPAAPAAPPVGSDSAPWDSGAANNPIIQKVNLMTPAELTARRVELTTKLSDGNLTDEEGQEITAICARM
jgi:hypothetical protein